MRVPFERRTTSDAEYFENRSPDRTYISKSFPLRFTRSRDFGEPTRYIRKVFDDAAGEEDLLSEQHSGERTVDVVTSSTRRQIQLMVSREAGAVRELAIQRLQDGQLTNVLKLDREAAQRLIALVQALPYIDVHGEATTRVDDALLRSVFEDPDQLAAVYRSQRARIRDLVEADSEADDIVALARRKAVVEDFRRLLEDTAYFEERRQAAGGKERVWQQLFEANPWILGIGISGHFFTGWDPKLLEQTVKGFSVDGHGKRVDALMKTSGLVGTMVLAEIKHHETPLLGSEYRSDSWQPSTELSGAVAQVQQTVHLAQRAIGDVLPELDDTGAELPNPVRVLRPRSYLIAGSLSQFQGSAGGLHRSKFESFELFRRNLYEPEILTFDEVLARAEWQVQLSDT